MNYVKRLNYICEMMPSQLISLLTGITLFFFTSWFTISLSQFFFADMVTIDAVLRTPLYFFLFFWYLGYWSVLYSSFVSRKTYWQVFWFISFLLVGVFILFGRPETITERYGDVTYLESVIESGAPYTRWLIGTEMAIWLYTIIWKSPILGQIISPIYLTASTFVSLLTAMSLCLGSVILFRFTRLTVVLAFCTMNSLWFLFASGYSEYYPLIVVPFVGVLVYIFNRPLTERPAVHIGILIALLPFIYIGFAPFSIIILAIYTLNFPKRIWHTILSVLATAIIIITVFWPDGVASYFDTLYMQLNFFSPPLYEAYIGQEGVLGLFISVADIFTQENIFTKMYMLYWGNTLFLFGLFVVGLGLYFYQSSIKNMVLAFRHDARYFMLLLFNGWVLLYALFMLPKLLPRRDIDLFFVATLVVGFTCGLLWYSIIKHSQKSLLLEWLLMAVLFGHVAVLSVQLIFLGIPELG